MLLVNKAQICSTTIGGCCSSQSEFSLCPWRQVPGTLTTHNGIIYPLVCSLLRFVSTRCSGEVRRRAQNVHDSRVRKASDTHLTSQNKSSLSAVHLRKMSRRVPSGTDSSWLRQPPSAEEVARLTLMVGSRAAKPCSNTVSTKSGVSIGTTSSLLQLALSLSSNARICFGVGMLPTLSCHSNNLQERDRF